MLEKLQDKLKYIYFTKLSQKYVSGRKILESWIPGQKSYRRRFSGFNYSSIIIPVQPVQLYSCVNKQYSLFSFLELFGQRSKLESGVSKERASSRRLIKPDPARGLRRPAESASSPTVGDVAAIG